MYCAASIRRNPPAFLLAFLGIAVAFNVLELASALANSGVSDNANPLLLEAAESYRGEVLAVMSQKRSSGDHMLRSTTHMLGVLFASLAVSFLLLFYLFTIEYLPCLFFSFFLKILPNLSCISCFPGAFTGIAR